MELYILKIELSNYIDSSVFFSIKYIEKLKEKISEKLFYK